MKYTFSPVKGDNTDGNLTKGYVIKRVDGSGTTGTAGDVSFEYQNSAVRIRGERHNENELNIYFGATPTKLDKDGKLIDPNDPKKTQDVSLTPKSFYKIALIKMETAINKDSLGFIKELGFNAEDQVSFDGKKFNLADDEGRKGFLKILKNYVETNHYDAEYNETDRCRSEHGQPVKCLNIQFFKKDGVYVVSEDKNLKQKGIPSLYGSLTYAGRVIDYGANKVQFNPGTLLDHSTSSEPSGPVSKHFPAKPAVNATWQKLQDDLIMHRDYLKIDGKNRDVDKADDNEYWPDQRPRTIATVDKVIISRQQIADIAKKYGITPLELQIYLVENKLIDESGNVNSPIYGKPYGYERDKATLSKLSGLKAKIGNTNDLQNEVHDAIRDADRLLNKRGKRQRSVLNSAKDIIIKTMKNNGHDEIRDISYEVSGGYMRIVFTTRNKDNPGNNNKENKLIIRDGSDGVNPKITINGYNALKNLDKK